MPLGTGQGLTRKARTQEDLKQKPVSWPPKNELVVEVG